MVFASAPFNLYNTNTDNKELKHMIQSYGILDNCWERFYGSMIMRGIPSKIGWEYQNPIVLNYSFLLD